MVGAGTIPEDNIHLEAIALTDTQGNHQIYSWEEGFPHSFTDGLSIMLVRLKGEQMPFVITESKGVWVDEVSTPDDHRFNHYDDWLAWNPSLRGRQWERTPETGYREFWKSLPSHSSLMHFMWDDFASSDAPIKTKTKVMLNGMTDVDDVNALIPPAKSWENPPRLVIHSQDFTGGIYDKSERAFQIICLNRNATALNITLHSFLDAPILNPCFLIENWAPIGNLRLKIDGQIVPNGANFKFGIEKNVDKTQYLVVWLRKK